MLTSPLVDVPRSRRTAVLPKLLRYTTRQAPPIIQLLPFVAREGVHTPATSGLTRRQSGELAFPLRWPLAHTAMTARRPSALPERGSAREVRTTRQFEPAKLYSVGAASCSASRSRRSASVATVSAVDIDSNITDGVSATSYEVRTVYVPRRIYSYPRKTVKQNSKRHSQLVKLTLQRTNAAVGNQTDDLTTARQTLYKQCRTSVEIHEHCVQGPLCCSQPNSQSDKPRDKILHVEIERKSPDAPVDVKREHDRASLLWHSISIAEDPVTTIEEAKALEVSVDVAMTTSSSGDDSSTNTSVSCNVAGNRRASTACITKPKGHGVSSFHCISRLYGNVTGQCCSRFVEGNTIQCDKHVTSGNLLGNPVAIFDQAQYNSFQHSKFQRLLRRHSAMDVVGNLSEHRKLSMPMLNNNSHPR